MRKCTDCNGSGKVDCDCGLSIPACLAGGWLYCKECFGTGEVKDEA